MTAQARARKLEIIYMLKRAKRPITLKEVSANFPDDDYNTVGIMLARMAQEGMIDRGPFGGYVYAADKICRKAKHKAVCKFMKSKKTALDISELYDAGFIAGRSV